MKYLAIPVLMLLFSAVTFGQTLVLPGDGTLRTAIESAEDGAVLQLLPGGEYVEDEQLNFGIIDKSITITIDGDINEDLTDLPVLMYNFSPAPEEEQKFFLLADGASLHLNGIEIDGRVNGIATVTSLTQPKLDDTFPVPITIDAVKITNCRIHDLAEDVIDVANPDFTTFVVTDSTIIDNVISHNTGTIVYYKYGGANYVSVTNSTFARINSYGFRITGYSSTGVDNTPVGDIDHTTWYDVGFADPREIILGEKGPLLNPWTVTNSILVKIYNMDKTFINIKETTGDSLAYIASIGYWEIGSRNWRSHTVKDTLFMDPQFADPDNGDFTLPDLHPFLAFGTDGGAIGDLRWATGEPPVVSIDHKVNSNVPNKFELSQNFPNPFNPSTVIKYAIPESGFVIVKVYNLVGQEISTLVEGNKPAGNYEVSFDASAFANGIYLYSMTSGNFTATKKMVLIK